AAQSASLPHLDAGGARRHRRRHVSRVRDGQARGHRSPRAQRVSPRRRARRREVLSVLAPRTPALALDCEVVQTRSGAQAMRDKLSGELMHPVGPLIESRRLYVESSHLALRLQQSLGDALVLGLRPENSRAFGLEGKVEQAARELLERGLAESAHVAWELRCGELEVT